jgi:RNA polymerase sigma-70 factor, ECF subfamily
VTTPAPDDEGRLRALRSAISTLPDQDRAIVTLLLEGLSYKEIAEVTGITVNYVGVKISRIKEANSRKQSEKTEKTLLTSAGKSG